MKNCWQQKLPGLRLGLIWVAFIGFCLSISLPATGAELQAIYPKPSVADDTRPLYPSQVIQLALSKVSGNWQFGYSTLPMERARMEVELELGQQINVLMLPGQDHYDQRYLLVPFPVDRGLLGYRVSLIRQQDQVKFNQVRDLADLQGFTGCLNANWSITPVFQLNNLPLLLENRYITNFVNLARGACDYFSRGVSEVTLELKQFRPKYPDLTIEQEILVQLPFAFYLYVAPTQPKLQKALLEGLNLALKDNSFDVLFNEFFQQDIQALDIRSRRRIGLKVDKPHG